jgi:Protein of unknown function (DUF3592)
MLRDASPSLLPNKASLRLLLWLCLTIAFAIGGATMLDVQKFYLLSTRGMRAEARVTDTELSNHNSVNYSYEASRQSYQGRGAADRINRDSSAIRIGETFQIIYDPLDPASSCLGDPGEQLRTSLTGVVFISLIPTLGFISFYLRRGREEKDRQLK